MVVALCFSLLSHYQIDRATIDQIIADSGLYGLTVYTNQAGNSVLEFYYYGKPTDTDAFNEFNQSAQKTIRFVGGMLSGHRRTTHRAWFYAQPNIADSWGAGFTIPYTDVSSELRTQPKNQPNAVVSAVAQSLNPTARGFDQKNITKEQFSKQAKIAKDYDKAPLYDLDNPIVRRAYEELAAEVKEQYLAMPLRGVELITGQGEPYANSTEMREDVRINNKIKVFATTPDSFGSNPNIDSEMKYVKFVVPTCQSKWRALSFAKLLTFIITSVYRSKIMYVCICNAVTDRQIKETVDAGAQSLTDLKNQLGVATCCGCCSDLASSFLTNHAVAQANVQAGISVQN